ncbi:MAG: NADH:ubiquinone reductase (Na(+)-transporting) subunit B [Candidatus Omnitrophica bacterium]|nr:NADH:ubiquinone reductase (Na(+)-transporting) subunit B [Candidatus Omnitrophota bacterium]
MNALRTFSDNLGRHFQKGKPLEKLYPLYEATDSFLFTPGTRATKAPFIHDKADLKRVMVLVVLAVIPAAFFGIFNAGYQAELALGVAPQWTDALLRGLMAILPIILVSYTVGGFWEVLFACTRKHEINEGFFVTGILFALTLPPHIPLWQVAIGISFGVVVGKEIFGGTGMNIVNPALAARAFLFFAYPGQMSGDKAWLAVDGVSKATPLAVLAAAPAGTPATTALTQAGYTWHQLFIGFIPGSIGETSKLACLLGLALLLITGVASWRIIAGCVVGLLTTSWLVVLLHGPHSAIQATLPPHWHLVLGGFAFGAIFMATDPVSASATQIGRWIYGILIGVFVVLIRVFNPAYPEAVMLSILVMNIFAPLIDHIIVEQHIRRRASRG